jgi:hypothetical protein
LVRIHLGRPRHQRRGFASLRSGDVDDRAVEHGSRRSGVRAVDADGWEGSLAWQRVEPLGRLEPGQEGQLRQRNVEGAGQQLACARRCPAAHAEGRSLLRSRWRVRRRSRLHARPLRGYDHLRPDRRQVDGHGARTLGHRRHRQRQPGGRSDPRQHPCVEHDPDLRSDHRQVDVGADEPDRNRGRERLGGPPEWRGSRRRVPEGGGLGLQPGDQQVDLDGPGPERLRHGRHGWHLLDVRRTRVRLRPGRAKLHLHARSRTRCRTARCGAHS